MAPDGGGTLSPGHPVTLTWDNGQGLVFTRVIAIDDKYMFTVTDSVANKGGQAVTLYPYGTVGAQKACPRTQPASMLHQGFVGVANGSEMDAKYTDFKDPGTPPKTFSSTGGWVGITDKYWMAAVVPPQGENFNGAYLGTKTPAGVDAYQANYRLGARSIAPGASASVTHRLFAGAKVVDILRGYQDSQNIARFDKAVDWGWFWFLTRPFFWLLDNLYKFIGNFGLAILGLTVIVKLLFFPLAKRQLPLHEQDEEAAAADGGAEEAAQGRSAEAAAGDDGAVQAREGQSAVRLPADRCSPFRCSSRSTRCSTSPSRCGMRLSMAGSTTCRRPIPPRSSTCSACCPSIRTPSAGLPGLSCPSASGRS